MANVLQHPRGGLIGIVGIKQVLHAADHLLWRYASLGKVLVHLKGMLPRPCPLACLSVRDACLAACLRSSEGACVLARGVEVGEHG